ncbi:MAG: two-component sensor histidine kinase [Desulfobacula sp. RIFOXYA12_FULL_46_16]|nr:MAG: two-component sensor histidine kinase [Desulfobacula sp. RIFOXYA12_FULL_46_16]OGR41612.1 MAG: two-component sensor histidine kinase [Desulfobacula sp. RIFOXYB2_FULL_45_6]
MENLSAERNAFYQELSRKIKILILVISFFPFILTTGFLFYRFNLTYTEKIQAHVSELVQKHTQNIDTFLSEKLGNIRYLAYQLENSSTKSIELFLKTNLELLETEYPDSFTDIGIVDGNGIQIAYEGPFNLKNADYKNAEWFQNAIQKPFYISDVFAGLRGHPHFIIAVKVRIDGMEHILRATINFAGFNSMVENIQIGKTGIAYILNADGQLQTKADIRIDPTIIASLVDYKNPESRTIITEKQDPAGTRYLYAISTLKNIDWSVVFRQDVRDAFSELRKTQMLTLVLMMAGCIAVIAVAFTLPRYIIKLISSAETKSEAMNRQVIESGKLASIGELAAGIAHEINNPVAIMVEEAGWIEDLLEDEDLKETKNLVEFKRALKQINTQGKRCKEITHKLLSFARKTDSTINDVAVNDAIREMVSLTAQMARYNNVIIETKLEDNLPFVRISPSELQQVMLNLINNAIDAMEKTGGTLTIETRKSRIEQNHIAISIEDTGPGIPKENLDRIFNPFFTTKAVGKGTGLGLSICYGLVQKMGGKIEVSSQVGVGTQFRIFIPFQDSSNDTLTNEFNSIIV